MAKIDRLKEEIANKREFLRGFIVLAITILSGIVMTIYKVASGDLDIYMLLFVAVGITILSVNIFIIKQIYRNIDNLTKGLENV
jgi:hypothetical protein